MLSFLECFDSFTLTLMKSLNVYCCTQKLNGGCQRETFLKHFYFYSLFDIVTEFLQDCNSALCDEVKNTKGRIAYS